MEWCIYSTWVIGVALIGFWTLFMHSSSPIISCNEKKISKAASLIRLHQLRKFPKSINYLHSKSVSDTTYSTTEELNIQEKIQWALNRKIEKKGYACIICLCPHRCICCAIQFSLTSCHRPILYLNPLQIKATKNYSIFCIRIFPFHLAKL